MGRGCATKMLCSETPFKDSSHRCIDMGENHFAYQNFNAMFEFLRQFVVKFLYIIKPLQILRKRTKYNHFFLSITVMFIKVYIFGIEMTKESIWHQILPNMLIVLKNVEKLLFWPRSYWKIVKKSVKIWDCLKIIYNTILECFFTIW